MKLNTVCWVGLVFCLSAFTNGTIYLYTSHAWKDYTAPQHVDMAVPGGMVQRPMLPAAVK
jgi:hypothetical protein